MGRAWEAVQDGLYPWQGSSIVLAVLPAPDLRGLTVLVDKEGPEDAHKRTLIGRSSTSMASGRRCRLREQELRRMTSTDLVLGLQDHYIQVQCGNARQLLTV